MVGDGFGESVRCGCDDDVTLARLCQINLVVADPIDGDELKVWQGCHHLAREPEIALGGGYTNIWQNPGLKRVILLKLPIAGD